MALTQRVGTSVIVVDDELDDVVMSENVRIGVHTINSWIRGILADTQDSSKGRHFLCNVSVVVPRSPSTGLSNIPSRQKRDCITCFGSQSQ